MCFCLLPPAICYIVLPHVHFVCWVAHGNFSIMVYMFIFSCMYIIWLHVIFLYPFVCILVKLFWWFFSCWTNVSVRCTSCLHFQTYLNENFVCYFCIKALSCSWCCEKFEILVKNMLPSFYCIRSVWNAISDLWGNLYSLL